MRRIEKIAYVIIVVGVLLDHASTMYALTQPNIVEVNPFVLSLMEKDLWLLGDLLVMASGTIFIYALIRMIDKPEAIYLLIYPIVHGLIRIAAAVHNFGVIFP